MTSGNLPDQESTKTTAVRFLNRILGPHVLVFLSVVAVLSHWDLIRNGLGLLHSDYAPGPLVAQQFRNFEFSVFHYGMTYGGVSMTVLRALWSALWESVFKSDSAYVMSQMSFTYGLEPVLLTLFSYFLARSYASRLSAVLVAIVAAVGLRFWIEQYGNDIYIFYLLFGMGLLGWRARLGNPFKELSLARLFAAGVLSGLAVYTYRASVIYIVAFFIPLEFGVSLVKRCWHAQTRMERWIKNISLGFVLVYFYLEAFGPELGVFFGRRIKLHAGPNLNLAVLLFVALAIKVYWRQIIQRFWVERGAVLILGFFIGFLPEFVFWLKQGKLPPSVEGAGAVSLQDSGRALLLVPQSLRELFTAGSEWTQVASLFLVSGAIVSLVICAKSEKKFRAAGFTAILAVIAYCRIRSYVFAPARYLLPLVPVIFVGMAALWDLVFKRSRVLVMVCLVVLAFHLWHHWSAECSVVRELQASSRLQDAIEVVRRFQAVKVSVVISEEYWHSNQYSFLSRLNPIFISTEEVGLRDPQGIQRAQTATRIGVLLKKRQDPPSVFDFFGRHWRVIQSLEKVGDRELFVAERVSYKSPPS